MKEYIVIFITTPDEATANHISRKLIEKRFVACAQINGPIKSIYEWEEEILEEEEWRVVLKSKISHFNKIKNLVLELHPYEVPQIIALSFIDGYKPYLKWIDDSMSTSEE